jgi:uncharacterized membrane protein
MAPEVLAPEHPLWFRVYGSFAAPLFILISGMMVSLGCSSKDRGLGYFLLRGALIVALGALIDVVVEGIRPFTSMDVLYLIGLSLPVAYLARRLPVGVRWAAVPIVFAATPLLQQWLGYTDIPTEYRLNGALDEAADTPTSIPNHWLIDGWFPLLPWIGFSLLGVNLGEIRWGQKLSITFRHGAVRDIAIALLAVGMPIGWFNLDRLQVRGGYSELFYPPTIGYILTACGVMAVLFWIVDRWPTLRIYWPLQVMGGSALFAYVLHRMVISYVLARWWHQVALPQFLLVYVCLLALVFAGAYLIQAAKRFAKELLS